MQKQDAIIQPTNYPLGLYAGTFKKTGRTLFVELKEDGYFYVEGYDNAPFGVDSFSFIEHLEDNHDARATLPCVS